MRIYVSQKDINEAREKISEYPMDICTICPVANAIKRRHPTKKVVVGNLSVTIGNKEYMLAGSARRLINDFDYSRKVKPQHITLILDK